ncbi:hypothetical protein RHMOL_Rhmol01G0109600 [Rhododendron molle]|uniref:Uncharacterized protein n=1 Tax=Rhododendron molle TaxID=49168 RepID=A0ACC0PZW2_RHOML|nr:hypothetical protein RHMOL_Rhmol01G0109600 [Rhododendron molle]
MVAMLDTVVAETEVKNKSKSLVLKAGAVFGFEHFKAKKPTTERTTKYEAESRTDLAGGFGSEWRRKMSRILYRKS